MARTNQWKTVTFLAALAIAAPIATWSSASGVPGEPFDPTSLDAIVARGCGQFCTTQGLGLCTQTPVCTQAGSIPFIACTPNGTPCDKCTGLQEFACTGTLAMNGELCFTYPLACCVPPLVCVTGIVNWGPGHPPNGTDCGCAITGTPNVISGTRVMCSMDYNYPNCGGT